MLVAPRNQIGEKKSTRGARDEGRGTGVRAWRNHKLLGVARGETTSCWGYPPDRNSGKVFRQSARKARQGGGYERAYSDTGGSTMPSIAGPGRKGYQHKHAVILTDNRTLVSGPFGYRTTAARGGRSTRIGLSQRNG